MQPTAFSSSEIASLRQRFQKLDEVVSFSEDPVLSSKIACYGMMREIGTVNDELARFIFDANHGTAVRLASLKSEIVQWKGLVGLRVWSLDTQRLELRAQGFYDVVHLQLSQNEDGSLHSLCIFPEIINEIAKSQDIELVLVKSWGMNSIFGGFDPAKSYYQTNYWELENIDALKFADLASQGKLAFLGTHDLIAHIGGLDRAAWLALRQTAKTVYQAIESYFKSVSKPSISAAILPYTIGVVLDDLAQPPSYGSVSHLAVLEELLKRLNGSAVPANMATLLTEFPASFQMIIDLSRTKDIEKRPGDIEATIDAMIFEIRKASVIAV